MKGRDFHMSTRQSLRLVPNPQIILLDGFDGPVVKAAKHESLYDTLQLLEQQMGGLNVQRMDLCMYLETLPEGFSSAEGYVLLIDQSSIRIYADTDRAMFYAKQTLYQIMFNIGDGRLPTGKIIDWPKLKLRGAHICYALVTESMPQLAPDFAGLIQRIRELAHYKMNCIMLEIEAMFPYEKHAKLPSKLAFTRDEIEEINKVCKENFIEVIPLVQSIGHNYYVLKHSEYANLREVRYTRQQLCLTNPKTKQFYFDLVDEIIDAFPNVRYFHIGADETWNIGKCERCREAVNETNIETVFASYVNDICGYLTNKGVKPIIYSDMLELFPVALDLINREITVMYWNYEIPNWPRPYMLRNFTDHFHVICASAARYGTINNTMYKYPDAMTTTNMLAAESIRNNTDGFIITDWMKAVPYELTMPTLVYAGNLCWSDTGTLDEYEKAFGCLYFGVDGSDYARAMTLLTPLLPYCEDAQIHAQDTMDRYDQSGMTLGERIRKNTAKGDNDLIFTGFNQLLKGDTKEFNVMATYEKTMRAFEKAMSSGKKALEMLRDDCPTRNKRAYELIALSAKTQVHKARMGILFDKCENLLKYPEGDTDEEKKSLVQELDNFVNEWEMLRKETYELIIPGTFRESAINTLDFKFEPEVLEHVERYKKMFTTT